MNRKITFVMSLLVATSLLLAACATTANAPATVPVATPTVDPIALNGAEICPGEDKFVEMSVTITPMGEGKSKVEMSLDCMTEAYARRDDPRIVGQSITSYFVVIETDGFMGEKYEERLFADFISPIVEGQRREALVEGEFEIIEVMSNAKGECEALGGNKWRCP